MFERFTPGSKAVVIDAQVHARRLQHGRIGTEHLLLSLLASDHPIAAVLRRFGLTVATVEHDITAWTGASTSKYEADRRALAALGIDLDRVREATESEFGPGALAEEAVPRGTGRRRWRRPRRDRARPPRPTGHIPFGPRAKNTLELALREALRLRHRTIEPEHIALGILRDGEGLACAVLTMRGVSMAALRAEIEAQLATAA